MTENMVSKSEQKKLDKETAKRARKAEVEAKLAAEKAAAHLILNKKVDDIEVDSYGFVPLIQSATKSKREWTSVENLADTNVGNSVWVRARVYESRCKGSIGFLVIRDRMDTVQVVADANSGVSKELIKWAGGIALESVCDFYGKVVKAEQPVVSTTKQNIEIHLQKMFCVTQAASTLPFQLKDANSPETDAVDKGSAISVGQDTRLDNRILDLRTYAAQAIFRVQSMTCHLFREFLLSKGFMEIHSPKLLGGTSEGGANVFKLDYFGGKACLAQSPQLYKQMALAGDFDRVFEIGPVFRAENSNTHRHLCEFTGLDMEMTFKETYEEVLDVLDSMFVFIFKGLAERCKKEWNAIHSHYGTSPFKWTPQTPRLSFAEGLRMLRGAHPECDIPEEGTDEWYSHDLSTEEEKLLGNLVKEKYGTDFYMLLRYPLSVRPFYSMPCPDDSRLSNTYDFFMRGEEIVSGAQRIHDPDFLMSRAMACGVDTDAIKSYIDAFRHGMFPHGGAGIGLERVVMLFLGLNNIRKSSLFPRDPKRLAP